jgi:hypothetical protein
MTVLAAACCDGDAIGSSPPRTMWPHHGMRWRAPNSSTASTRPAWAARTAWTWSSSLTSPGAAPPSPLRPHRRRGGTPRGVSALVRAGRDQAERDGLDGHACHGGLLARSTVAMRLTLPAGPARKTILRSNRLARRCALAGSRPADVPTAAPTPRWRRQLNDRSDLGFKSRESFERLVIASTA